MENCKEDDIILISFLLVLCVVITLFINLAPAFGGNLTSEQKDSYKRFDNYVHGKFVNAVPTSMFNSSSDSSWGIKDSNVSAKDRNPDAEIPVDIIDWNKVKS